jgi:phosphate transport system substrate-binding protein
MLAVPAAAGAKTKNIRLIGSGSSGAQPYMQLLFSAYHKLHHNINFTYTADGGNQGVKDVQKGVSEFAVQTALTPGIGVALAPLMSDALCVDVNSKNSLGSISFGTLENIYAGNFLTWTQVGGNLGNSTIDLQGRNTAAGEYTFFTSEVMGTTKYAQGVTEEPTDGLVAQNIKNDRSAIGYVGLGNSVRKGVKRLKVSGTSGGAYACTAANIKNGHYPLWHYDYGVLPYSGANKNVVAFFNWITDTKAAAKIVNKAGAVATKKHRYGRSF